MQEMFRAYAASLTGSLRDPVDPVPYSGLQLGAAVALLSGILGAWAALAGFHGHLAIAGLIAGTCILCLVAVWYGHRVDSFRGRHAGYVAGVLGLAVVDLMIGPRGNIDAIFPGVVIGPFLLFSWRHERRSVLAQTAFATLAYLATIWLGRSTLIPALLPAEGQHYTMAASISGLALVIVEMTVVTHVLSRKNATLEAARSEALLATQAKGHFLAAMSHEIRTPMNGVVGMVELLEATDMDDSQRRMLRTVRQSAFSLLRIIDDILDVSKADADQIELHPVRTDWLDFLEAMTDAMGSEARRHNVRLVQFFEPGLPGHVVVDPGRLRQVLINLIGNAIKFSKREDDDERPAVVQFIVRTDPDGWLRLSVTDNGIGIQPDQLTKIFDPFAQASRHGSARFGGTGLGLTIARRLVQKMGGTIEVQSEFGEGSTFTVRLPMAEREGRLAIPDLSGVTVVLRMDAAGVRLDDGIYMRSTGATLFEAPDEATLFALAREYPDAIFLLGPRQPGFDVDDEAVLRFQRAFPAARCVTFSARPSDRFGQISPTTVRVHWGPMRLSELWAGMAAAAGRSLPVAPVALADTVLSAVSDAASWPPVLLVEDNDINREVLTQQLKRIGIEVVSAINGAEGLATWRAGDFPLILSDCHMPLMDGFEMTTRIREIERLEDRPRTVIIAITANTLAGEAERCLAHGMDDYLSKPVRMAQLRDTLMRWGAERVGSQPNSPAVISDSTR